MLHIYNAKPFCETFTTSNHSVKHLQLLTLLLHTYNPKPNFYLYSSFPFLLLRFLSLWTFSSCTQLSFIMKGHYSKIFPCSLYNIQTQILFLTNLYQQVTGVTMEITRSFSNNEYVDHTEAQVLTPFTTLISLLYTYVHYCINTTSLLPYKLFPPSFIYHIHHLHHFSWHVSLS